MNFKRSFVAACALVWCGLVMTALGAQAVSFPLATAPLATSVASQTCSDGEVIDVMIVGSGLTGGTAAYYLNKKGLNVLLTDARDEAGGNLITKQADGFQWEEGPNSFQPSDHILRFAKDLGLIEELILANASLPRFVYWDNQLIALPASLGELCSLKLLGFWAKLRLGFGLLGFIKRKPQKEETLKEFAVRHFGKQVFERVIDPFVSGVYAGDPAQLSAKAALGKLANLEDVGFGRGILTGAFARFKQIRQERLAKGTQNMDLPRVPRGSLGSFKKGMQSVPIKIEEALGDKLKLSHKLVNVTKVGNLWASTFETPNGTKTILSKALMVTAPAYVAADILGNPAAAADSADRTSAVLPAAAELSTINYPPVAAVTLAYPTAAFKMKPVGFGHLIPRAMKIRTLGTIWASSLFPEGRAPANFTVLTSFIGGAQDPGVLSLTNDELVAQVHKDTVQALLTPDAPLPKVLSVKMWARAIPQYNLGHRELLARLDAGLKSTPGLYLGGNYKTGVSIGDCIQFGIDAASKVQEYVQTIEV